METIKKILIFAIILGVITGGVIGVFIVFDLTNVEESREALIKILSGIAIGTAVAIVVLLLSRFAKK